MADPTERQLNHLADVATRLTLERNEARAERDRLLVAHSDVECSECGATFCETVMREVEAGVHAHSLDFTYRFVCPYCWMRKPPPDMLVLPVEQYAALLAERD